MKIYNMSLLLLFCSTLALNAYEFSFYNNTEEPIGIAIQYTGNDTKEPLYKQLVKPKSRVDFTPGKLHIPDIKWGFCLDNVYYTKNPTSEQKMHNFEKAPWRKIAITWVEEKSITKKQTPKKTQTRSSFAPAAPVAKAMADTSADKQIIKSSTVVPAAEKSLCRDRHFDIIEDEHGIISITSSLAE